MTAAPGLRWGILSTARINAHIIPELGGRLRGVASRDPRRAKAYAADHGLEQWYGGYDALLEDPAIDAVYLSLPNHLHIEWALRALEAGKHVLVEKPLSRYAALVEQAFDRADTHGLVLAEGLMWRHHPQVVKTLELIRSDTIGRVTGVHTTHTAYLEDRTDHRMDPACHGGALMDVGCAVSAVRTFAGEPLSVTAQAIWAGGVDIRMVATFTFPDGVLATMDCGLDSTYRKRVEIVGTRGSIVLNDPFAGDDHPSITVFDGRETVRYELTQPHTSYALELAEFERAARDGVPPILGRAECIAQARAIESLYAAAGTGT